MNAQNDIKYRVKINLNANKKINDKIDTPNKLGGTVLSLNKKIFELISKTK